MVLTNIFLIYFRQDMPLGPIMSGDTKLVFECLGSGYEAWSTMAGVALENLSEINIVIENATTDKLEDFIKFAKKYFRYELEHAGIIPTRAGPCLSVTLVQLDNYPVLAAKLKRKFNPPSTSGAPVCPPGVTKMTIQHPSEIGRDAEAAKGMLKLLFF